VKGEQPDAAAGRSLSRAELSALFHACADDPRPAGRRDAAILALGYAAGGLRRAEIVALDLADFNPTTDMLTIHGKGNKTRTAYVSGSTRAALDDWLEVRGREPGPLFIRYQTGGGVGQARDRLSEQAIYKMYKARAEQAGVADFSPHDVRRSFISDSLDAGVDVLTVSRLAGHADPKTTSRYDRRGERAKRQAADAIHVPYRRWDER
jgi:integrase